MKNQPLVTPKIVSRARLSALGHPISALPNALQGEYLLQDLVDEHIGQIIGHLVD